MLRVVNKQIPLPGLVAAVADSFRFTWWNTREGAAVWIEHRGAGGRAWLSISGAGT